MASSICPARFCLVRRAAFLLIASTRHLTCRRWAPRCCTWAPGMALLMTSLLSFAVVALYGVMFATVSVALIGGFMLGLLAFSLFITSGAAFFGATGAALGYATLAAAKASLRMLPGGSRPDPSAVPTLPESPRLRPVARPRAPVSPAIAAFQLRQRARGGHRAGRCAAARPGAGVALPPPRHTHIRGLPALRRGPRRAGAAALGVARG